MSDPIEILERRLGAVLAKRATPLGLHFFCQIGGYDDELGIITLQVSGSGNVLLSWRTGPEDIALWTLQFTDEDYHQFIRLFMTYPFWNTSPPRRGRYDDDDDEVNIHIRVSAQDVGTYKGVQFWSGDLDKYRLLKKLVTPLCKLIQSISRDAITDEELAPILER